MKTIVLTGGGTAGHCTPHFALLKYLENHFDNIYYIGSQNGIEKKLVKEKNIPYFSISTVKFIRGFDLKNLKLPFLYHKSVNEAKKILEKLKPDVVFSKGGYVGLPVCHASKKLNIPVIVHESDYSMGLSNKISSKFASAVLTTFKDTSKKLKNAVYVGSPIREELFYNTTKNYDLFSFDKSKPTLLITGGSTGAKSINDLIFKNASTITQNFNLLHLVGKGNLTNHKLKNYKQIEFADMQKIYPIVDVCVSRCGSNTAFELLSLNIPTIFIPLPKTISRGDQIENAKYFENLKLCKVLYQENLTFDSLYKAILKTYENKEKYIDEMKKHDFKNANKKIIEILTKY